MRGTLVVITYTVLIAGCAAGPVKTPTAADWEHKPLREIQRLAKANDIHAKVELGRRYGTGTDVPKDYEKAVTLFSDAAETHDPLAEYYLGTAYELGAGVTKNEQRAVEIYQDAARLGQRDAQYRLAMMVIEGRGGIAPTWSGAIPLLTGAAEQDLVQAQFLLANAYATGFGVERDPEMAANWYRRCIKLTDDNQPAIQRLSLLINRGDVKWQPGDPGEAPTASGEP